MLAELNYPAVVAAALLPMALGALWYGPLFGKAWMSAHGHTPERLAEMQQGMGRAYGLSFLCYLVMATVLAYLLAMGAVLGAWR